MPFCFPFTHWFWFFFGIFMLGNSYTSIAQDFIKIDTVILRGLKKTKALVVLRELNFRCGEVMKLSDTAAILHSTRNNLLNTRLFHTCTYQLTSIPESQGKPEKNALTIELQERWYTLPIPVLELADRNFNEWWYDRKHDFRRINAGLTILQKNVRGRNEDFLIGAQTGFTRRLDFSYFIPYLDKRQILGLKVQGIFLGNREVAVRSFSNRLQFVKDENSFGRERIMAGIQLLIRKNINRYHSLECNYHSYKVSDFIFNLNPNYFLGSRFQRYLEFRYTHTLDYRNYRFYATKGWMATFRASRIGVLSTDNFKLWSCTGSISLYRPLTGRFYLATKLDGEIAEDKRLPYLGSRTLGYENRFVRGYERNVLEGNASIHLRNSLRMKVFSQVWNTGFSRSARYNHFPLDAYLVSFFDAGYMYNRFVLPENRLLVNTGLAGFGLGLHIVTVYDLVFRTEYSFNRQGGRGLFFSILSDI